jgi:HAD superfamily hydrolase (TIGR01509 family)
MIGERGIVAILFDADGVLQQSADGWREQVAALCPDPERSAEFVIDVFAAERPCLVGAGDFREAIASILRRYGSATDADAALRLWWQITPHRALLDLVRSLRDGGMRVALASNQHAQRARYMSQQLDYASAFDHTFFSCDIGYAKPDRRYFGEVAQQLGAAPRQLLFIDDLEANVDAARSSGLRAEVFNVRDGVEAMQRLLRAYELIA